MPLQIQKILKLNNQMQFRAAISVVRILHARETLISRLKMTIVKVNFNGTKTFNFLGSMFCLSLEKQVFQDQLIKT